MIAAEHRKLHKRAMTPLMLVFAVFCCVSGGPYGLEPLVGEAGPGLALLLIALMPVVWALPDALTTCELAPALPVEGGYIVWVKRALGPFAGFLNAWWTWIYTLVDAALYPVLFTTYLSSFLSLFFGFDGLEQPAARWATTMGVIAAFTWLNIRGTRLVGKTSTAFAVALIVPFLVLVVVGFVRLALDPQPIVREFTSGGQTLQAGLASGMAIVMWNYLGWDALSTIAEEVEEPAKAYPRALLIGVPLVFAAYFFPTLVGLAYFPNAEDWVEGAWPAIGQAVGGPGLGLALNIAGLISPIALFTASLLASSRVPFVMAEDGFLPKGLVAVHPVFGTPWRAILLHGVIYALLAHKSFLELIELNVIMYSAALFLESLTLFVLRVKEPGLHRPFKVPGGLWGVGLVAVLPVSVACVMVGVSIVEEGWEAQWSSAVALASGPLAFWLARLAARAKPGWFC